MYGYQERMIVERYRLRIWDCHVYTAIFKIKCRSMGGKKKPQANTVAVGQTSDRTQGSIDYRDMHIQPMPVLPTVFSAPNTPKRKLYYSLKKVGLKLNIQKTKITTSNPITSWQIDWETMETVTDFISWAPKSLQMVTAAMKFKDLGRKAMTNFRQHIKKQSHYFADNGPFNQSYDFSSRCMDVRIGP